MTPEEIDNLYQQIRDCSIDKLNDPEVLKGIVIVLAIGQGKILKFIGEIISSLKEATDLITDTQSTQTEQQDIINQVVSSLSTMASNLIEVRDSHEELAQNTLDTFKETNKAIGMIADRLNS